jgi:hypothetical protein
MKMFYPQTGTLEEWNSAYYRLEDYFRAHRVTNKLHQSQIILRLLQRAAAQHALDPSQTPTRLALEEAYEIIDQWFQHLLPEEPPPRAAMVGRVGMQMIDATERWPNVFLAEPHETPLEFQQALRDTTVQSGPDLRVSSMVPRPLDPSPVEELSEESWERLGKLSVLILIGMVGLFAGAVALYFVR